MLWTDFKRDEIGEPLYVTPNYDTSDKRSCLDYQSGIPEIDSILAEEGKEFSAMNAELGILVYKDVLTFMLVKNAKAVGHFSIHRDKVVEVKAAHGLMLNIRKDPGINSGAILSAFLGILGAIAAITIDLVKGKKKIEPVLGSRFEIIFDSTKNGKPEKIIVCCSDKNKERIGAVLGKIVRTES